MSMQRPAGNSERAPRASHANGAGSGVPASERVGGSGGAKPPGKKKINAEYRT